MLRGAGTRACVRVSGEKKVPMNASFVTEKKDAFGLHLSAPSDLCLSVILSPKLSAIPCVLERIRM